MEKLFIQNRHNKKIVVLVDKVDNQIGLVFIAHGLGGFKEQPHVETMARAFVDNRYTVVRFDTSHTFGESEGTYENANITNYLEDLEDVLKWSINQEWYQEPFCLAGHSLGGISTLLYTEANPDKVKAIAPTSTVLSGEKNLARYSEETIKEYEETGWMIRESSSKPGLIKKLRWHQFAEDVVKYDVLPNTDKLSIPVLLIVGSEDMGTPPEEQKILYDKLDTDKELHIIEGSGHTFREQNHLEKLYIIFNQWIKNKL